MLFETYGSAEYFDLTGSPFEGDRIDSLTSAEMIYDLLTLFRIDKSLFRSDYQRAARQVSADNRNALRQAEVYRPGAEWHLPANRSNSFSARRVEYGSSED